MHKVLTFEKLIDLCSKQGISHFDAKEVGESLLVTAPATYEIDADMSDDFILYGKVQILHTGSNRNKSNVTEEAAKKILDKIKYRPLLANFCEVDGEADFTSHDMEIDEDGNITYFEHQIGSFVAEDAFLEEDEEKGKTYLTSYVAIPREYTDAADIIERKGGTKISAELLINEMVYDKEKKEMILKDIDFLGATCLGKNPDTGEDVEEGMEGAFLDISFDKKEANLADFYKNYVGKEEKSMTKLDTKANEETKVVLNAVDPVDITDDTDTSDAGPIAGVDTATFDAETEPEANEDESSREDFEEAEEEEVKNCFSITFNGETKTFAIDIEEKIWALKKLVNDQYGDEDTYYQVQLYEPEGFIVMTDYWAYPIKHYRQNVSLGEDGLYVLDGERVEVTSIWVTPEEEEAIKNATTEFALNQKKKVLDSEEYSTVRDTEEFKALYELDATADEVRAKADDILLNKVKENSRAEFSAKDDSQKQFSVKGIKSPTTGTKSSRYGNLFSK